MIRVVDRTPLRMLKDLFPNSKNTMLFTMKTFRYLDHGMRMPFVVMDTGLHVRLAHHGMLEPRRGRVTINFLDGTIDLSRTRKVSLR